MEQEEEPRVVPEDPLQECLSQLETSSKLRNIPKFLENLLKSVKSREPQNVTLPPKFMELLATYTVKMPIGQNLTIWRVGCDVLQDNYTAFQDNNSDGSTSQVCLASEILATCILNLRLVDKSIYDETISQVVEGLGVLLKNLKSLFQMSLLKPLENSAALLTLAFAYGELHQLLLLYCQAYGELNRIEPLAGTESESVWNLTYFHSYASQEEWEKLGGLSGESQIGLWAPLILQKIRFLVLFHNRNKGDKLVRKLIGFLMSHYSDCEKLWLNNIKYLLPFMNAKHLKLLGRHLANSPAWAQVLHDVDLLDKPSVQMTLASAVYQSIMDRSRKRKADEEEPSTLKASSQSVLKILCQQPEVWISSVDRAEKQVVTWLRQSAEYIRAAIKPPAEAENAMKTETNPDVADLLRPLDLIEKLPLEYATGTFHSATLMGLLALLFSVGETETAVKDRIWMMFVRLLDNPEKLSSLYDYIPSEEFIKFAVVSTKGLPHSAVIFGSVFDEVLRSPQGLKDISKWAQSADFDAADFDVMVIAMEKLSGHSRTVVNETKKELSLQMFDALRIKFLKHFESCLDSHRVHALRGAITLLKMHLDELPAKEAPKLPQAPLLPPPPTPATPAETPVAPPADTKEATPKKESKKEPKKDHTNQKIRPLLRKLPKLVITAQKGLVSSDNALGSSSADLLSLLFNYQKKWGDFLPAGMRISVWNAYRQSSLAQRWEDKLLVNLIGTAKEKELLIMVNAILQDLQEVSVKSDPLWPSAAEVSDVELRRVCSFFRHLVAADIQQDHRYSVRIQAVQTALPLIQHMILAQCQRSEVDDIVRLALPPMAIYLSFLNNGKAYGYPQDLASALHVSLALPLDDVMDHAAFIQLLTPVYKVVHYLLSRHEEVAADRIPVLLQAYRRLLQATALRADQRRRAGPEEVADLTDCANRLSRLASMINTQRLRYRRVAAYLVADVMEQFQKRSFYPPVKHELVTALHHLMDMLDIHAARYLLSVLPAGVRELFRVEYDQFQKFYQFKGKV